MCVCFLTFTLAKVRNLLQRVSHSWDDLVVHVQQWPAALREAAVMEKQPVQQKQTFPEQRSSWAAVPRQRWGDAALRGWGSSGWIILKLSIYPPWPRFLLLHLMLDWPVESICSWEPRRSNHWRWKIITTVWTSWQRPREKTMIKDGSWSSMSTNWADSADIYLCVTLTAALQVCPTFSSLSEGSAQQANHLTHKYNNNSNNNNKMNY